MEGDINKDLPVLQLCHYCNGLAGRVKIGRPEPWQWLIGLCFPCLPYRVMSLRDKMMAQGDGSRGTQVQWQHSVSSHHDIYLAHVNFT